MQVLEVYDQGGNHRMRRIPKEVAVAQNAVKYNHRFYSTSHHDGYVPPGPRVNSITSVITTDNALADGIATNVITFTAHDSAGAPVPNAALFVEAIAPAVPVPVGQVTANASGVLVVNVTSATAGPAEVIVDAIVGGAEHTATCTFAPPAKDRGAGNDSVPTDGAA